MRSKEEAHDYRYFPDPDLPPLVVERAWIDEIARSIPELPHVARERYQREFALSAVDAEALVTSRELAEYFEAVADASGNPRAAANWVRNEVLRVLNEQKADIARLARHAGDARTADPTHRQRRDRRQVGEGSLRRDGGQRRRSGRDRRTPGPLADQRSRSHPRRRAAASSNATPRRSSSTAPAKTQLFGFLVGQLMKETRGKANAEMANAILRELLGG